MRIAPMLVLLASSTALAAPPAAPPAPASVYRFDLSVTGIDASPATYTMLLAEGHRSELRSGTNVPFTAGGGIAREQLGMRLDLQYEQRGNMLLVEGGFDMSALVPSTAGTGAPTWGRLEAKDLVVPVTPDKPVMFASLYDVATHHRYQVTITAHRAM